MKNNNILKGKNLISEHYKIIDKLISKWKEDTNILGIVILGGAARGFADKYSDIDLAVFFEKNPLRSIHSGEKMYQGFDIEIFPMHYNSQLKKNWDEIQRQAYSESKILFDKNNKVKKLLDKKLKITLEEKKLNVSIIMLSLGWYGINYKNIYGNKWKGYLWLLPEDIWLKRGSPLSAHYVLNHCIDLLIHFLFTINGKLLPDFKWRYYLIFDLPWLPKNFDFLFRKLIETNEANRREFAKRLKMFKTLYNEAVEYAEKQKLIPENIYSYYLKNSEDYSPF